MKACWLALGLLCWMAAMPAHAINKCTGPDGQISYQEVPCTGAGITVEVDSDRKKAAQQKLDAEAATRKQAKVDADAARKQAMADAEVARKSAAAEKLQKMLQTATLSNEEALAKAREKCKRELPEFPVVGMTESNFLGCTVFGVLARPDKVNETENAAGITRQYIYVKSGSPEIRYLYTRNGLVTTIQR